MSEAARRYLDGCFLLASLRLVGKWGEAAAVFEGLPDWYGLSLADRDAIWVTLRTGMRAAR